MKKILVALLMFACLTPWVHAQNSAEKTVVFLLPMNSGNVEKAVPANMREPKDIDNVFGRSLVGFWGGAQIAIDELAEKGRHLNIIAKELNSNDEATLNAIFSETQVQKANLIVAPVSKDMFPKVAALAQRYKIPVVNPLSNNSDIIAGNPFVYKMRPPADARPAILVQQFPNAHFIIWGKNNLANDFVNYFTANNISFKNIEEESSFTAQLSNDVENVVIACTESNNAYAQVANALTLRSTLPSFHWVLPEKILNENGLDLTILSPFSIYFLSDFFVDEQDESTKVFIDSYTKRYHTTPSLVNFAYQGYDATYFFIELICNDFHIPKDFSPLACQLKFKRQNKANGFENYGVRLVKLEHLHYSVIK